MPNTTTNPDEKQVKDNHSMRVGFWNGEPVYTSVMFETNTLGDGENNGPKVKCATKLIVKTPLEVLPEIQAIAKEHEGLYIWGGEADPVEYAMAGSEEEFNTKVQAGENPLASHFGVGVHIFNLDASVKEAGLVTGVGASLEEAVDNAYDNLKSHAFDGNFHRSKADMLADYPTSIVNKYKAGNGTLFNAPGLSPSIGEQFDEFRQKTKDTLYGLIQN